MDVGDEQRRRDGEDSVAEGFGPVGCHSFNLRKWHTFLNVLR